MITSIEWLVDHANKGLTQKEWLEVVAATENQHKREIMSAYIRAYCDAKEVDHYVGVTELAEEYYKKHYL